MKSKALVEKLQGTWWTSKERKSRSQSFPREKNQRNNSQISKIVKINPCMQREGGCSRAERWACVWHLFMHHFAPRSILKYFEKAENNALFFATVPSNY